MKKTNRITRHKYLDRLKNLRNTPDIKIITGIRRSGKSELLSAFINFILADEPSANVISIDYYDIKFDDIKDYKLLNDYVEQHYDERKNNYLFIDEVQLCKDFEIAINSLHNSGKYDIYITGSNAFLLSSDLATLFTGRFIQIPVLPFSFEEYIQYQKAINNDYKDDLENEFDHYAIKGGLSGSYEYSAEQDRAEYIKDVYNTIVKRDLVDKYNIADESSLDRIAMFLMDNISNLVSNNSISNSLTQDGSKTNHVTVGLHLKYLCNAFLFYEAKRFDIKGKKYLKTNSKYYLSDIGIRYALLGTKNMDYGRVYENLVYLELIRRGYDVYVGKLFNKEIDFVALKQSEKLYIQVADNISDEKTLEREIGPLLQIRDAYPKHIIARTRHSKYQREGIQIFNFADWLLNDK